MKSIRSSFDKIQSKQGALGDFPSLAMAVMGKAYTQDSITRAFTKLVAKNEYALPERRNLIKYLTNISNPIEGNKLEVENKIRDALLKESEVSTIYEPIPQVSSNKSQNHVVKKAIQIENEMCIENKSYRVEDYGVNKEEDENEIIHPTNPSTQKEMPY